MPLHKIEIIFHISVIHYISKVNQVIWFGLKCKYGLKCKDFLLLVQQNYLCLSNQWNLYLHQEAPRRRVIEIIFWHYIKPNSPSSVLRKVVVCTLLNAEEKRALPFSPYPVAFTLSRRKKKYPDLSFSCCLHLAKLLPSPRIKCCHSFYKKYLSFMNINYADAAYYVFIFFNYITYTKMPIHSC